VFRRIHWCGTVTDTRLSGEAVSLVVKKSMALISKRRTALRWSLIALWVLYRRGGGGMNEIQLMRVTGHSDCKMLREYIAEATLYDTNTSALLGL
jgi:hypothetical protein